MLKIVRGKVKMDIAEMLAVFVNTKFFEGNWDKQLEWVKKYGSQNQREEDPPLLEELKRFEKAHNVVLFDHLPADWREIEPPEWLMEQMKAHFRVRK